MQKTMAVISHGNGQRWNSVLHPRMNVLKTASVLRSKISCFRGRYMMQKLFHYISRGFNRYIYCFCKSAFYLMKSLFKVEFTFSVQPLFIFPWNLKSFPA